MTDTTNSSGDEARDEVVRLGNVIKTQLLIFFDTEERDEALLFLEDYVRDVTKASKVAHLETRFQRMHRALESFQYATSDKTMYMAYKNMIAAAAQIVYVQK